MLEIAKEIIQLVAAIAGLATAWFGYQAILKKQKVTPQFPFRTLRVRNPSVRTRPWRIARIRWFFIVPIAVNAVVGVLFLGQGVLINLLVVVGIFGFVFLMRTEPPSRTLKRAEYLLAGSRNEILDYAVKALTAMGANIGRFDSSYGLIEAGMPMTWRSFGEVVVVTAYEEDAATTCLRIESDVVQPSVLTDWGANSRNIRRFQEQLILANVHGKDDT